MSDQTQPGHSSELDAVIGDALRQAESAVVVDRADLDRRRRALFGWLTDHVETEPKSPAEGERTEETKAGAAQRPDAEPSVVEPMRTDSHVVAGTSGRVLVVDDNKVIRQLIRTMLEHEGFEVVTAADGAECLDVIHHVRPDVVTLDVVMPRLDGLRTAARLRADPRTRDLPLAIISACTQYEVESALGIGVDAFLGKPFDHAELVGLVRQLIERKGDRSGASHPEGESVFGGVLQAGEAERAGRTGG